VSRVVPLLKFTPSAQDPDVLETITVQRESLIAKLVEVALDRSGGSRNQLLIGPRGMGKTHILSLVASRIRAEAGTEPVTLAWLEEDPWAIGSYEKFLAAIVAQVADERSDPELIVRADELHATRDGEGREAEQVLRDALRGSRLVVLIENLDEIFRRIGVNGQERLRAFVEDWRQMLIIATAPRLFEGVQLHESPFYGFFAITHLEELSLENAAELMRRVAELRGDQALVGFLGTDVAQHRLAAVEALAGGHPRIWLLLSGCVSISAIDELVPLFLEALDDLTPYYQDRLRELGDQQQELVVLLGEAGGALSNRALSERSGLPQNQVATILRQLTDRGYVRRAEVSEDVATGDARMSYWELREPLMRLCLDVKQARGKPLRMVVEFLRSWYGPRLLDELMALPPSAQLATAYANEAFRTMEESISPEELFRGSSGEILARAEAGLLVSPQRADLRLARSTALIMEEKYPEARDALESLIAEQEPTEVDVALRLQLATVKEALEEDFDSDALANDLVKLAREAPQDADVLGLAANGLVILDYHEGALELFPQALALNPEDSLLWLKYGQSLGEVERPLEALAAFTKSIELEPANAIAHFNRGMALGLLDREEEALRAFEKAAELEPDNSLINRQWAAVLGKLGRDQEALDVLAEGLALDPADARMLRTQGGVLQRLGRIEESLAALDRAAALDPDDARTQGSRGVALGTLGRYEEAFHAFARAIELDPANAALRNSLGVTLLQAQRFEDAQEVFEAVVDLDPGDAYFQANLGAALTLHDRTEDALAAFTKAIELEPDMGYFFTSRGLVLVELDRLEDALADFETGIEVEPSNLDNPNERAKLLLALGRSGEAEAAARAVLEQDGSAEYRFTLIEVLLARGSAEEALTHLREALVDWKETPLLVAAETGTLCRILWKMDSGSARKRLVESVIAAYTEADAADELARGLVSTISHLAESAVGVDAADEWSADWAAGDQVEELTIPLRMVRAAVAWKRDRDRSHLLDLPAEQREILVDLLREAR
jgi:tetratricopeptide (TPR) repeat protein